LDDTSGLVLVGQAEFEYSYDAKSIIENIPYRPYDSDTIMRSIDHYQYIYTLDKVKVIPIAGWENDPTVADSYADTNLLQTEFEYEWYGYEDADVLVSDTNGYGHPGRRTQILTKYIDQLGGETNISYYPRQDKSTLKEGSYTGIEKCAVYNGDPTMGKSYAFDIHPAVQFITKLDEKNNTETIIPGAPLKRWEYRYDTTQIIYQSFDYNLLPNFRGGYK
jgi:hypothetical protein